MLIATRNMKCFSSAIKAGDPIPEPKKWHPSSLQSNINLGWIREATADEEKAILERQTCEETARVAEETFAPPMTVPAVQKATPTPPKARPKGKEVPDGKEFICVTCTRTFKRAAALLSHERTHQREE